MLLLIKDIVNIWYVKILLITFSIPKNKKEIRNFNDVLNFYLNFSLNKKVNCECLKLPSGNLDKTFEIARSIENLELNKYDAILAASIHFFYQLNSEIKSILKKRFDGLLLQVSEGAWIKSSEVDIYLTLKDDIIHNHIKYFYYLKKRARNVTIGWAADHEILVPKQDKKNLHILIDHSNYGKNLKKFGDSTKDIIEELKIFVFSNIWKNHYDYITVRRLAAGKIVELKFTGDEIDNYDPHSNNISFTEISKEYGKAHIFMVTHPESLGLTALECAMAGALILSPKGFIHKDRLRTVRHYEYKKHIDWDLVLKLINVKKSREVAKMNNWSEVANKIIEAINKFKKR